jgi:DNA end-binding protein Ku
MRSIWKGAVSFGLVNVPVRLYAATEEHDIRFHQVHRDDGGRIRYKRTCTACGEEVGFDDIAKGYETSDGQLVILTDDDLNQLPVATGHEIDVVEFVPSDQVDPILFAKSYFLEPDARGVKPYALLREALVETDRMAIVRVALRQRETLAVLRVRDKVILLQTMFWPDEIREADFKLLDSDIELRPQEMKMAASLIDSMAVDFEPAQFTDEYRDAVADLIESKLKRGDSAQLPSADKRPEPTGGADVIDLLTALQRSVDQARGGPAKADADSRSEDQTAKKPARKAPAKKVPAKKAPAKRTATKATAQKVGSAKADNDADTRNAAQSS